MITAKPDNGRVVVSTPERDEMGESTCDRYKEALSQVLTAMASSFQREREKSERWNVSGDGKTRRCLWCGNREQHLHTEMVPKTEWRNGV